MQEVGQIERKTQDRVVKLFVDKLGYKYLGNLMEQENQNVVPEFLCEFLQKQGYSDYVIKKSVGEFLKYTSSTQDDLYHTNKAVYQILRYGLNIKDENNNPINVFFIEWDKDKVSNNDFYVAEEVTIVGQHTKRPDVVVYVNGIALAVLELKRSTVSMANGIRQNLANQKDFLISHFFSTIQLCVAGNDTEGTKYGVIETPEKYYLEWKNYEDPDGKSIDILSKKIHEESNKLGIKMDRQLYSMFYPNRFLEICHDFIIFDKGKKKTCRHNQYFGVREAEFRIQQNKGGIIWHTQGSGKSLTMVWLTKWILENYSDGRVLIITDREELDDQIEKVFLGVEEKNIKRTKSCRDLLDKLNEQRHRIVCSLIHKFGKKIKNQDDVDYEQTYDNFLKELKAYMPDNFSPKGRIFVFVDECHRTQSGKLHEAMKKILPGSIFIGFTGTPLLKKDKTKSIEVFGNYIHTYKFDEAVSDGVVLDLRYDPRDIPQEILSQDKIDAWFESKTAGLTDSAKAALKSRWGTLSTVFSSRSRLEKIAVDIIEDFETKPRLKDGSGNAMLVAGSIYSACKYYEIFQNLGFKKCAIVTSFNPGVGTIRTEVVGGDEETETFEQYEIYQKMLNGKDVETFEKQVKEMFINEPNQMKLLIVVDKLLTGFDAPPATYLYIDKSMRDHGLFQAICRVNRLDDESKEYGYIVDYKQLFGKIKDAVNDYTSGAFDAFDEEDVKGLIKNRVEEAKKSFEEALEKLDDLCEGVKAPKSMVEYQHFFCGDYSKGTINEEIFIANRERLYRLVSSLVRAYVEIKPDMSNVGYTNAEQVNFEKRVNFYIDLKEEIYKASGDYIDLKAYEPGMRFLIDNYISAGASARIGVFENLSLLDFVLAQGEHLKNTNSKTIKESVAEVIENNIRKKIVEKQVMNPKYYSKMSTLLMELIEERKKGVIEYKELLEEYVKLANNVVKPEDNGLYPQSIKHSPALRAIYDNFGEDEEFSLKIHNAVLNSKQEGFRGDLVKERRIKRAIYAITLDEAKTNEIYKLISIQEEY